MQNKTYQFCISDRYITVFTEEVIAFYGQYHKLTEREIDDYAAHYVAQIKYFAECQRWLDKNLINRLLEEEHLMKVRESDGFKLQLEYRWYVEIKREDDRNFKYSLQANCLDNPQTFSRKYETMNAALLHCLNSFNENAAVTDRYKSIEHYLDSPTDEIILSKQMN